MTNQWFFAENFCAQYHRVLEGCPDFDDLDVGEFPEVEVEPDGDAQNLGVAQNLGGKAIGTPLHKKAQSRDPSGHTEGPPAGGDTNPSIFKKMLN